MSALTPIFVKDSDGEEVGRLFTKWEFEVETTDINDGPPAVRAAVAAITPPSGQRLVKLSGERKKENPFWIDVVAEYEVKLNASPDSDATNPLDRPSTYSTSEESWDEAYHKDNADTPKFVKNAAGDLYEDFPKRKNGRTVLNIVKNVATDDEAAYDLLRYTRNADSVTIRGTTYVAGALLMRPITVEEVWERVAGITYHYFKRTTRMEVDSITLHNDTVEERGFYCIDEGLRMQIFDGDKPCIAPWPLSAPSGAKKDEATDDPDETTYEPYALVSWGLDFS